MTPALQRDSGRGVSWPHLACGAFLVLWLSVGVASSLVTSVPAIVKVAVLGTWVFLAACRSASFLSAMVTKAWPLVVMLLISLLYRTEVANSDQYTQGFCYLLIAFALLCFYSQPTFRWERHVLMGVVAGDLVITGVRTFAALQTDPLLSRYLATTEENRTAVYGSKSFAGLGGYGYAYALAAILLVLLYFFIRARHVRIPIALVVAAGLVILFELAFTTAIVLVVVLGAAFLVRDLVSRELRIFVYAAAALGWITGLYSAILESLAGQSWMNAAVSERLGELSDFLSGGMTSDSDLGTRFDRWSRSIDIFLTSGPLGLAGGGTTPFQAQGGHSAWLDMLASYGVYALLLALFLVFAWRLSRDRAATADVDPLRRAWIYFLVLGVVNTLLFSTIVMTWMFFIPSLISWLGEKSPEHSSKTPEVVTV
jgi:hypothetical protein